MEFDTIRHTIQLDTELDALEAAMDVVATGDFSQYADCESQVRIQSLQSKMDYIRAKSIAAFDVWGAWGASGARSAKSYVAKECQIPKAEAARQLRRGHLLCHLPKFDEAWSRGEITKDHVDRIGRARNPRTEDFLERDEDMLLDKAIDNTFPDFERIVDYWSQHADPDGVEEDAMEQRARRDVYLVPSVGGIYLGKMTLDTVSGAIVDGGTAPGSSRSSSRRTGPRLKQTWAAPPKSRSSAGLRRSAGPMLWSRWPPVPGPPRPTARRPAPLFTVLVGYETMHGRMCELAGGSRMVLSPGSLLPWLDQAYIERAVFTAKNRVEVSETSRFFVGATRRALEIRDRECTDPYCHEPVERCQADHIIEWSRTAQRPRRTADSCAASTIECETRGPRPTTNGGGGVGGACGDQPARETSARRQLCSRCAVPQAMRAASTSRVRSSCSRVTCSSGWWASSGSPGPKFAAGTPWAQKEATSVQPTLARGSVFVAATRAASSG